MEIWKSIKGYEGLYSVSSLGRVRSEARTVIKSNGHRCPVKEKLLSCFRLRAGGYSGVLLHRDGEKKNAKVHRLVAEAFIPNPENKPQVNHKNGKRRDNIVENLEWCTNSENVLHGYRVLGSGDKKGTLNGRHVLEENDIREIRRLRKDGVMPTALSRQFGVSCSTIYDILNRKKWSHII
jgi:hypothetical protein